MKLFRSLLAVAVIAVSTEAAASAEIYDVDPAYRQEVLDALRRMLDSGNSAFGGTVSLLPTGQLLVDTYTDERQAQVAAVLEAIANSEPDETPTVTLRYWVLHGAPGQQDDPDLPDTLDGVIEELKAVHGDLGFSILDAAMVSSRSGQSGGLENDHWEIYQEANANGDRLNASLVVNTEFQELSVELTLAKGEFVVLGAATSRQIVEGGAVALIVNWPGN